MPRTGCSAADRQLTAALAARSLAGSAARYERWRRAGLLPRNVRRGAGRGRGSSASVDPATVEIAAALARHAGQGRDLRAAVIEWFFEAGQPDTLSGPGIPEPPDAAVVEALVWAVGRNQLHELVMRTRGAESEAVKDAFFTEAETLWQRDGAASEALDPEAMREALLTGADTGTGRGGHGARKQVGVQLAAAMALGVQETGPEALIALVESLGLVSPEAAIEWRREIEAAEIAGTFDIEEYSEISAMDSVRLLETAGIERLRHARTVVRILAGVGALLVMRGLLMPDTPGLAALRAFTDSMGLGPMLINMARQVHKPSGIAFALVAGLHPLSDQLHRVLLQQMEAGPPLLHRAGDGAHDAEAFMAAWLATITALSEGALLATDTVA